ncbi:MAG: sialidase family protein [Candidatus Thermoplasmatota archaeon]
MVRLPALLFAALALVLAGCAQGPDSSPSTASGPGVDGLPTLEGFAPLAKTDRPLFTAPILVDDVRAGGEPVIAITQAGTILVSSHPGFTHYHPSEDPTHLPTELVSEFAGQSYVWRSTDQGVTWTHIGLPIGTEAGPRSLALGVSDPEFTVMEDGAICFTDLEALAAASTSCSLDDGVTWLPGNPLGSGRPVDRQWLASYQDEFYFTANYFAGPSDFRVSTDKGVTWTDRGSTPCNGDVIANPANGHLYQHCNPGITVSTDGGTTWSAVRAPDNSTAAGTRTLAEPGLDAAGNVWMAWSQGEHQLFAAGTPDEGVTWPWIIDLTPHFSFFAQNQVALTGAATINHDGSATNGTFVWPWLSAGSGGRIAVSWIGNFDEEKGSEEYSGGWYLFTAYVLGADSASPTVVVSQLTPDAMHVGPICQSGTLCQATSVQGDPAGDRRLGDFFETTIGADGFLYGAWSNTRERVDDTVSHVQFVRQTGGVRLIEDALLGSFTPTQG